MDALVQNNLYVKDLFNEMRETQFLKTINQQIEEYKNEIKQKNFIEVKNKANLFVYDYF